MSFQEGSSMDWLEDCLDDSVCRNEENKNANYVPLKPMRSPNRIRFSDTSHYFSQPRIAKRMYTIGRYSNF